MTTIEAIEFYAAKLEEARAELVRAFPNGPHASLGYKDRAGRVAHLEAEMARLEKTWLAEVAAQE